MDDDKALELKALALDSLSDLASSFLYYDRKGDEELSVKDMQYLIENGLLTADEIAERFKQEIVMAIARNFGA